MSNSKLGECGNASACSIQGETCDKGICKCGTSRTCKNEPTGKICDSGSSVCKCNEWKSYE